MTTGKGDSKSALWSNDERTVALRMMAFEAARARAKAERGVTLANLAEGIGVTVNTLSKWLRVPPARLSGAATNMMDAAQVRKACAILGVSEEYLTQGYVSQPEMVLLMGPTDAVPDRYSPFMLSHAYAALSQESQSKVTAYVADLLRLQYAENRRALQVAELEGVRILADEMMALMRDHLKSDVPESLSVAMDSYENAARSYRECWYADSDPEPFDELTPASWFWERASEFHGKASDRGRKPKCDKRDDCEDSVF